MMYPHYFRDEPLLRKEVKLNNFTSFPVPAHPYEHQTNMLGLPSQNLLTFQEILKTSLLISEAQRQHDLYSNAMMIHQRNLMNSLIPNLQSFKPLVIQPRLIDLVENYKEIPVEITRSTSTTQPVTPEKIELEDVKISAKNWDIPKLSEEKFVENSRPKTVQSKFKNCYGLATGRVLKSIKECIKLMRKKGSEGINENSQFHYIYKVIGEFSEDELKTFEDYVKSYHTRKPEIKCNRGKSVVNDYFAQGGELGVTLVGLVMNFLEPSNQDLQSYIHNQTKQKTQVSQVLSNPKDLAQLRNAFKEMQDKIKKEMIR